MLAKTFVAFVAFCLAASGAYCLNDASDAEADRQHPKKRRRPVAAGEVSVATARSVTVPVAVQSGNIQAGYRDGVLTVTLPKSEESTPKQIQVNAS